jgi:hypothetical protein
VQASRISRTQSTDAALAAIGHAVLKSKNEMTSVVSDPCGYFRCRVHRRVAVRLRRCCDPGSSAADECRFRPGIGLQGHSEERADLRQKAEPLIRDLLPQQISEPARCHCTVPARREARRTHVDAVTSRSTRRCAGGAVAGIALEEQRLAGDGGDHRGLERL